MKSRLIGIDTGGTFTDIVYLMPDGQVKIRKVPSTPYDPSLALIDGLREANMESGFSVVHGTTVATNALLERKGSRTALITTQGCRDVLEIARQTRDSLYDLCPAPRNPLIPRELRFEVGERLNWQGNVLTELDVEAVERTLDEIQLAGVETVAVCFLFSFLNNEHELEVGRRARRRGLSVSLSSDIAPEFREHERTATVCANAYVAPVMSSYIAKVQREIMQIGGERLSVMQSNGGTLKANEAAGNAIKTVLSGPAGGLVAAVRVAREAGFRRIMAFDMGGTSTDVSLVDGEPVPIRTAEVAGLPMLTPMLDIHTVGAGGGSIARIDAGGGLRVGPQSAGADPGPVAYGTGSELTVTDANVLLGRLPPATLLAGSKRLSADRVRAAFDTFSSMLGLRPQRAAMGIIEVVNAHMARALRHVSVEKGHDPADYVLVSFGGAGGLHACALAQSLGIGTVMIPRYPGAFSALGLALAEVRREYARSLLVSADERGERRVSSAIREFVRRTKREFSEEGVPTASVVIERFVEARYVGQSYALRVPFRGKLRIAARGFHRAHRTRYGYSDDSQPIEIVTVGVSAHGSYDRPTPVMTLPSGNGPAENSVPIWFGGPCVETPVYRRDTLGEGQHIAGPAVITQDDATTLIEHGWSGTVDQFANLVLNFRVTN